MARKVLHFQVVPGTDGDNSLVCLMDDGTIHEFATDPETNEKGWTALGGPDDPVEEAEEADDE